MYVDDIKIFAKNKKNYKPLYRLLDFVVKM